MIEIIYIGKLCTINKRYNKNFSLTTEYSNFKKLLGWQAKQAMTKQNQRIFVKNIELECKINFSYLREKDIDSIVKPVLDALQGIVYENDISIKKITIEKQKSSTQHEGIRIIISPIDSDITML